MIMQVYELNLDGLVGPTHHYAGLSPGNLASISNAQSLSNPQAAARQGLAKMRLLHRMGFKQALLPPHQRPNLQLLDQLGFSGTPAQQIEKANRIAPELLSACYSASYMWAANAATVSASLDTQDHRVHFTAANLVSNLHRYQEAAFSKYLLETIFNDEATFVHHAILPRSLFSADEGAANHNRLCSSHHSPAINLFVFGKQATKSHYGEGPYKYPARQTLEASQAIARTHRLNSDKVIYARQNPKAIDQGVFHNDVIAVANESIFLVHEDAFVQQADVIANLRLKADFPLQIIEVNKQRITLNEAVSSYFFNSQLLTLPGSSQMILISPIECQNNRKVKDFIDELIADSMNPITGIYYLDLRQSMRNGGGPACLRLRVPLTKQELDVMQHGVLVTEHLLDCLDNWVMRHYRSELCAQDLADPQLINENFYALDELSQLLALGSIYPFQREIMS